MTSIATFEQYIREAISAVPNRLRKEMDNVAFVVEEDSRRPRARQRGIRRGTTLLGLYEGVPLTKRGYHYGNVLPDKITIFKRPIEVQAVHEATSIRKLVHDVVWHEIAHHFGFSERHVRQWEMKRK